MKKRVRRTHSREFKVRVALEALTGEETLAELTERFDLHPKQMPVEGATAGALPRVRQAVGAGHGTGGPARSHVFR